MRRPTLWRGVLFGLLAALAVLAKYYSLLLIAACLMAVLASRDRKRIFMSAAAPCAAAFVFLSAITPHVVWVLDHHASPLGYAFNTVKNGPLRAWAFAVTSLAVASPMLIVLAWARPGQPFGLARFDRELAIISVVPFLLTVGLTFAFRLRGATAWAMPVFSLAPILIATWLPPPTLAGAVRIRRVLPVAFLFLTAGAFVVEVGNACSATSSVGEPRSEIVDAGQRLWQASVARELKVVAGDTRLVSEATLSLADHPKGFPRFSLAMAEWMRDADLNRTGFIAFCRPNDHECREKADAWIGRQSGFACSVSRRHRFGLLQGPFASAIVYVIAPADSLIPADDGSRCASQQSIPVRLSAAAEASRVHGRAMRGSW